MAHHFEVLPSSDELAQAARVVNVPKRKVWGKRGREEERKRGRGGERKRGREVWGKERLGVDISLCIFSFID